MSGGMATCNAKNTINRYCGVRFSPYLKSEFSSTVCGKLILYCSDIVLLNMLHYPLVLDCTAPFLVNIYTDDLQESADHGRGELSNFKFDEDFVNCVSSLFFLGVCLEYTQQPC